MANITHDTYGTQFTNAIAVGHSPVPARDWGNAVRRYYFDYTVPTGGEADDNHCGVVMQLKKGTRLMGGVIKHDALGTNADMDIGLYGTNGDGTYDFLAAALDVAAVGTKTFGDTIALNFGYVLLVDCNLVLTVDVAAWDAGEEIRGYIDVLETE